MLYIHNSIIVNTESLLASARAKRWSISFSDNQKQFDTQKTPVKNQGSTPSCSVALSDKNTWHNLSLLAPLARTKRVFYNWLHLLVHLTSVSPWHKQDWVPHTHTPQPVPFAYSLALWTNMLLHRALKTYFKTNPPDKAQLRSQDLPVLFKNTFGSVKTTCYALKP